MSNASAQLIGTMIVLTSFMFFFWRKNRICWFPNRGGWRKVIRLLISFKDLASLGTRSSSVSSTNWWAGEMDYISVFEENHSSQLQQRAVYLRRFFFMVRRLPQSNLWNDSARTHWQTRRNAASKYVSKSGHWNFDLHLSVVNHSSLPERANQPIQRPSSCPSKAPLLSWVGCELWFVRTTSITASLNRTSCKIFITATSALLLLTYVVEWTLAEGAHLRPVDLFYRSLLYAHSLAFRDDCHVTCSWTSEGKFCKWRKMPCGVAWVRPSISSWIGMKRIVPVCKYLEIWRILISAWSW